MLDTPLLHTMWHIMLFCGMATICVFLLACIGIIVAETYDEIQRRYKAHLWAKRRTRQQARPASLHDDLLKWAWDRTRYEEKEPH